MHHKRGFTLIEVLVALSIASVLLLTIYKSIGYGLQIYRTVSGNVNGDALRILDELGQDIRSSYLGLTKESGISFEGRSTSLQFVSAASLNHNFSDQGYELKRKRYYLGGGDKEGIYSLNRESSDLSDVTQKQATKLSGSIKSIKFSFFDGSRWLDVWSSDEKLPQAISVALEVQHKVNVGEYRSYKTIIDIPVS